MISIDTDILESLVGAMTAANDAISEAVDVLNRITIHNDWGCKEKDAINEYTTTNKAKINTLSQQSQALLGSISDAAKQFITTESSISDMFQGVESIISGIVSIVPSPIAGVIGTIADIAEPVISPISDIIKDIFGNDDLLDNPLLNNHYHNHYDTFPQELIDAGIAVPICRLPNLESFTSQNVIAPLSISNFSDISFE